MEKFWENFAAERQKMIYERLHKNAAYEALQKKTDKREANADEVLQKLNEDERDTVHIYCRGEMELLDMEAEEVYAQGLRDGVKLLDMLGLFGEVF